jgi:hypothetical protein
LLASFSDLIGEFCASPEIEDILSVTRVGTEIRLQFCSGNGDRKRECPSESLAALAMS